MQTKNQPISPKQGGLFVSLLVLTLFLILAEISFSIQCSEGYFGDFKLIANHLAIPFSVVLPGILYFIFAQLLVHFVFVFMVWSIARLASIALGLSWKKTEIMGITLWFVALTALLLSNRLLFPNSKFSYLLLSMVHPHVAAISFAVLFSILLPIVLLACFGFFVFIARKTIRIFLTAGLGFAAMLVGFSLHQTSAVTDAGTVAQPNIILISFDSMRPDFLGFFGYTKMTPHIDQFLDHSTVFSESLTPIARTYPSWVSLLTGIYPKLNHIRTNLADQTELDTSETIPTLLREAGYRTIFATDETRFSNIDQRYGFDEVVSPPIGFNDFLLGTLNDFPLSNLVVNTSVGKYLFPYSYSNRAIIPTYDPNSFLNLLRPTLSQPRTKPTLLITHFCLPHFPYAWSKLPVKKVSLHHYQASLSRADQQFYDFMAMLKENNFLQHSIVILLSDHGEGVEIPGDRITDPALFIPGDNNKNAVIPRFYPPSAAHERVNTSGGHGTDVLGLSQYHTVLAFQTFGIKPNQVKIVNGIVTLMDIKPTLLDYLNLPFGRSSGDSLKDYVFGQKTYVNTVQDFFVESDFSPEAVRTVHPEERKVLFEGIDYFRIDPISARIVVKDSMLKMIISSKQYANYYGQWVLALYPQKNKQMMPILVDLKSGRWTNDLNTSFAKQSPAEHMLIALKHFFGKDIVNITAKKALRDH